MMRNQALLLLAAAAFGLAVGQASAADMPRKTPAYVPPPPPPYVWTGCYVGANVGGAWAHLEVTDVTNGVEPRVPMAVLPAAAKSAATTKWASG